MVFGLYFQKRNPTEVAGGYQYKTLPTSGKLVGILQAWSPGPAENNAIPPWMHLSYVRY